MNVPVSFPPEPPTQFPPDLKFLGESTRLRLDRDVSSLCLASRSK
jgi:hypothetical protein